MTDNKRNIPIKRSPYYSELTPDHLTYASKYVNPTTGVRKGSTKRGRPPAEDVEARERGSMYAPAPRVLTTEQTALCEQWTTIRALMNDVAAQGKIYQADEYLAQLRAIESRLPFNPEKALRGQ